MGPHKVNVVTHSWEVCMLGVAVAIEALHRLGVRLLSSQFLSLKLKTQDLVVHLVEQNYALVYASISWVLTEWLVIHSQEIWMLRLACLLPSRVFTDQK